MSASWCVAVALVAFLFSLKVNGCPDYRLIRYYNELGCSPVPEGSECPTSFNCDELEKRDSEKCWLKGQEYDIGQSVVPPGNPCTVECSCEMESNMADLSCIDSECPENFAEPPLDTGCYRTYELDSCCSTGIQCVKNDTEKSLTKCNYNGENFNEGQLLFKPDEPCKICICDKEFNGEPSCREVNCGLELHWAVELRKGCAPVFYGRGTCCPIQWRCPHIGDRVFTRKPKKPSTTVNTTDAVCIFGSLQLKVGDFLIGRGKKRGACQECSCRLPPHVTCIQKPRCKTVLWRSR